MVASTANATAVWGLFWPRDRDLGQVNKIFKAIFPTAIYKHGNIFLEILLGSIEGLSSNVLK
jgi:hypothetical protein